MICNQCGAYMTREEYCSDTSKADLDESFEVVWTCDDCGHTFTPKIHTV